MKRKGLLNISLILVLVLTLSCLMPLGVFATTADEEEGSHPIRWELKDENTIIDGRGNEYVYYKLPLGAFTHYDTWISYNNRIRFEGDGYSSTIHSTYPESGIIESSGDIFVTEAERQRLDSFFGGEIDNYCISNSVTGRPLYSKVADTDRELVGALEREYAAAFGKSTVTVDVTELSDLDSYGVFGRDKTLTVGYYVGTVFELDDGYYYVDYDVLENNNFDASGYLSFRSGSIELCKLSDKSSAAIDTLKGDLKEHDYESKEEYDSTDSFAFVAISFILIQLAVFVGGILIPLPFMVFGIIMANRKPRGSMRYWYSVSICAAAWMIIALVLSALLIVALFI